MKPLYWPGLEKERAAETEEGAGDAVVVAEEASPSPPLGTAALPPLVALPDGGVGDIDVDTMAAAATPPTGDTLAPAGIGADDAIVPSPAADGGAGATPPPAACEASAPSPTPLNDAAAKPATVLAVVVIALTTVIIVLPTSPRTMRLAMNGIKAIDSEKILAVRARSIIWLEPTKLFRTPFALRTAFMLERFTADMSTWRIA